MSKKTSIQAVANVSSQVSPKIVQQTRVALLPRVELELYAMEMAEKNPYLRFRYRPTSSPLFSQLEAEFQDSSSSGQFQEMTPLAEMREELLGMSLPSKQKWIGEVLLSSLLPDGTMSVSLESVRDYTKTSLSEVQEVFRTLQTFFPHIREVASDPIQHTFSRIFPDPQSLRWALMYWEVLQKGLSDLSRSGLSLLERRERVRREILEKNSSLEVRKILDRVDQSLEDLILMSHFFSQSSEGGAVILKPDIVITRTDNSLRVQKQRDFLLELSSGEERRESQDLLWREAKEFVAALEYQESFFVRLVSFLVQMQKNFFLEGNVEMFLYQKDLAKKLQISPSTISRTLKNKTFLFEGRIHFFQELVPKPLKTGSGEEISPQKLKKEIEDILEYTKGNRLTDEQIRSFLENRNIVVSRKTVNRYRNRIVFRGSESTNPHRNADE